MPVALGLSTLLIAQWLAQFFAKDTMVLSVDGTGEFFFINTAARLCNSVNEGKARKQSGLKEKWNAPALCLLTAVLISFPPLRRRLPVEQGIFR